MHKRSTAFICMYVYVRTLNCAEAMRPYGRETVNESQTAANYRDYLCLLMMYAPVPKYKGTYIDANVQN